MSPEDLRLIAELTEASREAERVASRDREAFELRRSALEAEIEELACACGLGPDRL